MSDTAVDLTTLQDLLLSVPEVTGVELARQRDVLSFSFREYPFLAQLQQDIVTVTHPGNNQQVCTATLGHPLLRESLWVTLDRVAFLPVALTPEGDAVLGDSLSSSTTELANGTTLTHSVCGGTVDVRDTTPTHRALHCRLCGFRVTFPNTVRTLGLLRDHFTGVQVQAPTA